MRKVLKSLLMAVLAITLIFLALDCKKEPDKISVRLKWISNASFAGDIVALKKGIFEKNGLDVTLNEGGFNLDPIKLVTSGSDAIGLDGPERVMLAQEEGLPIVVIAVVFQSCPVVFLAKTESGIKTPQDFVGHKVGIKPGIDVMMVYEAFMKREGVDRSKIKEIPIQFSLTPFLEGQIDVHPTYVNNEHVLLNQMGVEHVVIDPKNYGMDLYSMCYFTTKKMINEHPDVIERYLKSVFEGYAWSLDNRDEAAQIIVDYNPKLELKHQRGMLDEMEALILSGPGQRIGWMEKGKWETTRQTFVDVGLLKGTGVIDSVYTSSFIEKIYK